MEINLLFVTFDTYVFNGKNVIIPLHIAERIKKKISEKKNKKTLNFIL